MLTRLWNKLRSFRRHDQFERDLTEEIDFHRVMLERDNTRSGLDAETAAAAARRKFGNLAIAREDARRAWVFVWIEELVRDVRIAVRGCRRSPGFTLAAILVLALGLGANMAVFRFVDASTFETLPVPGPHELVLVGPRQYSYPAFREIAEGTQDVLANAAAWFRDRANLTVDSRAEYLSIELVSGRYFDTLGVKPALGRLLALEDDGAEGAHPVCTISYGLWKRVFAGSPDVIGTIIRLNNKPFEIVGVTERGFEGGALHDRADVHVPLSMAHAIGGYTRDTHGMRWLRVLGRLAPGVSREQAEGAVRARYDGLEKPGDSVLTVTAGHQGFGSTRRQLLDMAVIAQMLSVCVLVIACTSLMGLLLARVAASRGELAMRLALGASRRRLVGQIVVEIGGLVVASGIGAVAVAIAFDRMLIGILNGPSVALHLQALPTVQGVAAAFTLTAAVASVVALVPAMAATRALPILGLREGGRISTRSGRFSGLLVTAQIAACLVLLFGTGLLARTLYGLRTLDLGLDPSNVVVITASPRQSGYTRTTEGRFYDQWLERARRTPGVASASLAGITAMSSGMFAMTIEVPGAVPRDFLPNDNFNIVTPDYFETVGLQIIAGRRFSDGDSATSPAVAIVNEQFVSHYWPGESPIGRQFTRGTREVTIVGLVRTAKYQSVKEEPQIIVYVPHAQQQWTEMTLHARVTTDGAAAALVQAAREIDPDVPVYGMSTLASYVDANLANERVLNVLGLLFGALALLVAAAGLYGTVAFAVARRTREIGIRAAVGAQRHDIVRLFVGRTLWLVVAGIAIGVPAALTAGRSIGGVLYGVEPTSTSTLVMAAILLGAVALTATVVPALRGARVNPTVALKEP